MTKPDFILDTDIKIIMDWYNKGEENSPKALPRSIFDVMHEAGLEEYKKVVKRVATIEKCKEKKIEERYSMTWACYMAKLWLDYYKIEGCDNFPDKEFANVCSKMASRLLLD